MNTRRDENEHGWSSSSFFRVKKRGKKKKEIAIRRCNKIKWFMCSHLCIAFNTFSFFRFVCLAQIEKSHLETEIQIVVYRYIIRWTCNGSYIRTLDVNMHQSTSKTSCNWQTTSKLNGQSQRSSVANDLNATCIYSPNANVHLCAHRIACVCVCDCDRNCKCHFNREKKHTIQLQTTHCHAHLALFRVATADVIFSVHNHSHDIFYGVVVQVVHTYCTC